MKYKKNHLYIFSFYRFVKVNNKKLTKIKLDKFLKTKPILGTILIANEGINGSISGKEHDLLLIINLIKKLLRIRKLEIKINMVNFLPFNRIKIRLKKEIVSLGKGSIPCFSRKDRLIEPNEWENFINRKDLNLIDLRNKYEVKIGKFKNAIDPRTKNFREFPDVFQKMNINKNDTIAMYCTGGIRCEKAAGYLNKKGYKNVYQLKGGILNYLSKSNTTNLNSFWSGECFVFDNRVTVNKRLKQGKYLQCHGCRSPITNAEIKSGKYIKGVTCPYCFNVRTEEQKKNSLTRQQQIDNAELKNKKHPFKKINYL